MWIKKGYEDGLKGVEWWYDPGSPFRIWITGTSRVWYDWKQHLRWGSISFGLARINRVDFCHALNIYIALLNIEAYLEADEILIGGHSWGGGLAHILAHLVHDNGKNKNTTCIVAAPKREGNKAYMESCGFKAHVFRHRGDIVPFLPPWYRRYPDHVKFGKWSYKFIKVHDYRNYVPALKGAGIL